MKLNHSIKLKHVDRIVYFDPEVYPNFEEIKEPTNNVIYSAVSDELKNYGNYKLSLKTFIKTNRINEFYFSSK